LNITTNQAIDEEQQQRNPSTHHLARLPPCTLFLLRWLGGGRRSRCCSSWCVDDKAG
jgi:hypothetical protein